MGVLFSKAKENYHKIQHMSMLQCVPAVLSFSFPAKMGIVSDLTQLSTSEGAASECVDYWNVVFLSPQHALNVPFTNPSPDIPTERSC